MVANPPYIAADSPDVEASVSNWEPHKALFANADGLSDIIVIVRDAMKWLRFGGWLVIEIGHDQGQRVHATLVEAGYDAVEIRPDLAGRDRIAIGQRPQTVEGLEV